MDTDKVQVTDKAAAPDDDGHEALRQEVIRKWLRIKASREAWLADYEQLLLDFYFTFRDVANMGAVKNLSLPDLPRERDVLKPKRPALHWESTRKPLAYISVEDIPESVTELQDLAYQTFGDADVEDLHEQLHALTEPLVDTPWWKGFFHLDNAYGAMMGRLCAVAFYNGLRVGRNPKTVTGAAKLIKAMAKAQ